MNLNAPRSDSLSNGSRQANQGPRRLDSLGFKQSLRSPGHKTSNSDEEQRNLTKPQAEVDIFADPIELKNKDRRPRRNSESSVRDKKIMDPAEERRRRERKLRDTKRSDSKTGKSNKKLDVIDKLDVTSIYGTGRKSRTLS